MNVMAATLPAPPAPLAVPLSGVMSQRTWRLLHGPIVPTLLLLAWPNVLVMMAQASVGLSNRAAEPMDWPAAPQDDRAWVRGRSLRSR